MKIIIGIVVLSLSLFVHAQQGISIRATYFQPIFNNFYDGIKQFKEIGGKVQITNYGTQIDSQIYRDKNFALRIGLGYEYRSLVLVDEIDSVQYIYEEVGGHGSTTDYTATHYFDEDKPDLYNISHFVNFKIDFSYHFGKHKSNDVGVLTNLFFYENYRGFYQSEELTELRNKYAYSQYKYANFQYLLGEKNSPLLLPEGFILPRNFFTSAIDLQLYYQYNWNISDNFSLGVRASIGTNLYSDWKQFKKYVWAGFGLNIGFLKNEKVRLNKGELRK